ncbi:hypothetical protein WICMUC_003016 [Wickerhamomyces mucosus]|uniref:Cation-transporting P-type ATPase N-terminal domain-containing protein n=1 Tax=Wickerhamomyces mucosus TaxID=1378264 RepID=A0A9P8PMF9_9ASCO|nr:hypothetical protein WICMUC_003016 [Wickerhamomyces mucosus]
MVNYSKNVEYDSSNSNFNSDLESNKVKFETDLNSGSTSKRPNVLRRLSESSIGIISQQEIEPSLLLPPIFKTVSYNIDAESLSHIKRTSIDEKTVKDLNRNYNILTIEQISKKFQTDPINGLNEIQYLANSKQYGLNITSNPPSNLLRKILTYFFGGFGLLLMIGGILCCIAWKPLGNPNPQLSNLILGIVLFIVFIFQAFFNFWQDFNSNKVMKSISNMLPMEVNVVRNGFKIVENGKNLVPGDLLFINNGDRLPADVRFVSIESEFAFDRSILTGESKPIFATCEVEKQGSNYLESSCIGLQGTFCVGGSGYGIVVSIADDTVFGAISKFSAQPKTHFSPLQREILQFVIFICLCIMTIMILIVILWAVWLRKSYPNWMPVHTLIIDLVSVSISFVPQGLPIALTTCLVITAKAMQRNSILCKTLSVVETLGSVSTICSDKTGTLTKNKMFVTDYSIGSKELKNIDPIKLSIISKLCNSATWNPTTINKPLEERLMNGNATDQAILRFGESQPISEEIFSNYKQISEIAFNCKNKFMIKFFANSKDSDYYELMIKGAPDILIDKIGFVANENQEIIPINDKLSKEINSLQRTWASKGQRVVLLAYKKISKTKFDQIEFKSKLMLNKLMDESSSDLILSGLVGITDPPKDDIYDVVQTLKNASIKICMVTGDFELTAIAIAAKCGIIPSTVTYDNIMKAKDLDQNFQLKEKIKLHERPIIEDAISITGNDIATLNDSQWNQLICFREIVFSRMTPEHKLQIVEMFQERGHIVAMTGDGVNDAPSLKKADIGIAMNSGSDIAKESSDLILLKNSFSSMIIALKYGRLVFENLKKTIAYLLPAGTFAELWAVLLNVLFGFPQLLSSFDMIVISCLTDCAGAIVLAYEAPEKNLLEKKPRSISGNRLVNFNLILHSYFIVGTYCSFAAIMMSLLYFQQNGIPFHVLSLSYGNFPNGYSSETISNINNKASSIYFITLVFMQLFNLLAVRTRYLSIFNQSPNYRILISSSFAISVTFFFNYIPWFQKELGTSHVKVEYYFIAIGFGLGTLIYDELRKLYIRKNPNSFLAKLAW